MPYQITKPEVDALGKALAEYYEEAWQEGVKGLFDKMARSNMGLVTGYLDQAQDTYASLKKKSNDKFGITFKPALKQLVGVYLANKNDVASVLVTVAETALSALSSKIPVPVLGTVVAQGISFAAGKGQEELHKRSVAEADSQLNAKTKAEVGKFFTSDAAATDFIQKSIDQYKLICKYIQTLPATASTFDDIVAFPGAVFKVQAAASSLNVALVSVREYLAGMQERLEKIQVISRDYIATVRRDMPAAVDNVLQTAYTNAYRKGESDIAQKKYAAPRPPVFQKPAQTGGATQLAAYLANAVAQGYYDAGNRGPQVGLPRGAAMAAASQPLRPGTMPIPPVKR